MVYVASMDSMGSSILISDVPVDWSLFTSIQNEAIIVRLTTNKKIRWLAGKSTLNEDAISNWTCGFSNVMLVFRGAGGFGCKCRVIQSMSTRGFELDLKTSGPAMTAMRTRGIFGERLSCIYSSLFSKLTEIKSGWIPMAVRWRTHPSGFLLRKRNCKIKDL